MRALTAVVVVAVVLFTALHARAESPPAYDEARAIVKAGTWTIREVQRPRILGVLGRVEILVENSAGERKLLKLSQRNDVISTLDRGDMVIFTLGPTFRHGDYTFPAFGVHGGHKVPNPFLLDAGSYLIPQRVWR